MPTIWDDLLIILVLLIPFLLIQVFLSSRRRLFWGFIAPALWSVLGVWMIISNHKNDSTYITELIIFYLAGDLIFVGILLLIRYFKRKKRNT